ncbi:MAG: hypothetical protein Q9222_005510 [Ikaeria aurantiellina]
MEGGFCKALLMTTESGREVVAKIPCPNAGRAMYSTASEAAVLQYLNSYTEVPAPRVLAWNADATNPVGVEYIIMEKASGVQLFEIWNDITALDRLNLIKKLTQVEHQLARLQFPAYGSLYLRQSITQSSRRIELDSSLDPAGLFCVGPFCSPAWTDGTSSADLEDNLDMGPWLDLVQFGIGMGRRSIARARLPVGKSMPAYLQGTAEEHKSLLGAAMHLLPKVAGTPSLVQNARPVLWHSDLHMGNIFVSAQDHTQITCLIDWQGTAISPLFLQTQWPEFLKPPDGYIPGLVRLELVPGFENFDADEKKLALSTKQEADNSKAYELATFLNNRTAYVANWKTDESLRGLFKRIGDTWDDGIVPMQDALLSIIDKWDQLGLSEPCPLEFTSSQRELFGHRSTEYARWYKIQDFPREYLNTDAEGWISPEIDFVKKQIQNKALLNLLESRAGSQDEIDELRRIWPFPPAEGKSREISKILNKFREALLEGGMFKKLLMKHTPGSRVAPPKAGDNDSKLQLRLDAGEVIDGKKTIHLQVNAQAKNEALKDFRKKNGTHANLATATIDENTPVEEQEQAFQDFWGDVETEAKSKLG